MIRALLLVLCLLGAAPGFAQEVEQVGYGELNDHLPGGLPIIRTPWIEAPRISRQSWTDDWRVQITVDAQGSVTAAEVLAGPATQRDEVLREMRALRFRPFLRDGHPREITFELYLRPYPQDYSGPADRAFPERFDRSDVRIRLERTSCFGQCPQYTLEVTGDGEVTYRGESSVLIGGEHRWRIEPAAVDGLLALMRQADFFRLEGYYEIDASDLPTYYTGLDIGAQRKFVLNYGFSGMGGAMASTVFGDNGRPPMPAIVEEIETAIDRVSGARRFIEGDETTVAALRAERFNFRSRTAGAAMGFALSRCNMALARAFLAEGAPANARHDGWGEPSPLVLRAPACGDVEFARALIERGALGRPSTADAFLAASASSGRPEMVRLALRHSRAVNRRGFEGETLLMMAADAFEPEEDDARRPREGFDPAGAIALLLEAGANARALDDNGEGPLHRSQDAASVRLLLAAGADANARDRAYGRTPLFHAYDADAVRALIAGGADVRIRDHSGRTALFEVNGAGAVQVLIAAGLDVNEADGEGLTPIEVAGTEEVAQALIAAGARLPDDAQRMARLLRGARNPDWETLLPMYEAHARALGVAEEGP